MKKMRWAFVVLFAAVILFFTYKKICQTSPECACRNASPGDPTCMSAEQLNRWCNEQKNADEFPQCKTKGQ